MKRPFANLVTVLPAQLRHKTGEITIPAEARSGDYDLVVLVSPTWWFQTSMPIRSYLESPEAKTVLEGKPFACASVSRRYYSMPPSGSSASSVSVTAGGGSTRPTSSPQAARPSRCSRGSDT